VVESLLKEVYLGLNPYIALWLVWKVAASPGRVFGGLKLFQGQPFLLVGGSKEDFHFDNLMRQHVIVMDRSWMCKRNEESVDHLLLHCNVASAIWSVLFNRFGLCLDVSLICMIVGGPLVGQRALQCGKWCLCASFGVDGRKGMLEILRIGRGLWGYYFFVL
jgi:hypothetical protein